MVALNDLYAASNLFWLQEHSTKPKARIAATEVLAQLAESDQRTVRHLWLAVRDPEREVRLAAIAALDRLARRMSVLGSKAEQQPGAAESPEEALGRKAVEGLVSALEDSEEAVRAAALRVLTALDDARCVPGLLCVLTYGPPNAQTEAVSLLAHYAPPRSPFTHLPALYRGPPGDRKQAVKALSSYRDPAVVEYLVEALGDPDSQVRIAATHALASRGQAHWQQWVKGDEGDFDRLGEFGCEQATLPLIRALAGSDGLVRAAAIRSLSQRRATLGTEIMLAQILALHRSDIRIPVAEVLGVIATGFGIDALCGVAVDLRAAPSIRIACIRALQRLGDHSAVASLRRVLAAAPEEEVRRAAEAALANLEPDSS